MTKLKLRKQNLAAAASAAILALACPVGGNAQETVWVKPSDHDMATSVPDGFTVAHGGDVIVRRPERHIPRVAELGEIFRSADFSFANFEGNIVDFANYERYNNLTTHMVPTGMEPGVAEDLVALGIKAVSHANNHSTDFGTDGMRASFQILRKAGLAVAGVGETRQLACSPAYYDTEEGQRIAVIGIATTGGIADPQAIALDPNGGMRGRFGLCPLRTRALTYVTQAQLDILRQLERDIGYKAAPAFDRFSNIGVNLANDEVRIFNQYFKTSEENRGLTFQAAPQDEKLILDQIRLAKLTSDFVIVHTHSHESPSDYLQSFARRAIDAGADEWLTTGPHKILGIEIYRERPIFYGLNTLFFEVELTGLPQSQAALEMMDPAPDDDFHTPRAARGAARNNPWSVKSFLPVTRYENNKLAEIRIHPLDLAKGRRWYQWGSPGLAKGELADEIFSQIRTESQKYGTEVSVSNGIAVIKVRR